MMFRGLTAILCTVIIGQTIAADPFFGIDGAMSWLTGDNLPGRRAELAAMLRDHGITSVRERLSWQTLNPAPGVFSYPAPYDLVRQLLADVNIQVLDLYHDAPRWTGADGRDRPYCPDLPAVRDAWRNFFQRWGNNYCGWEIWNEPDIGFGGDLPFDQYHVLLKTVNLAAGDSPIPLIGMVSAREIPEDFHRAAARTHAFRLLDAVSFHSYNSSLMLENAIAAQQQMMGADARPIWLTESGFSFPVTPGQPPEDKALHASAWHIVVKTVDAKAAGIVRYYPFIFSNYHEGPFSFSMLDPESRPYPSLTAYFASVRLLQNRRYLGDLELPGAARARVFGGDDTQILIAVAAAGPDQRLPALPLTGRLFDLYGNETTQVPAGFVYLQLPAAEVQKHLKTDSVMAKLAARSRQTADVRREHSSPLVIQPLTTREMFYKINASGYYFNVEPGRNRNLPVRVWNLGSQKAAIELETIVRAGDQVIARTRYAPGSETPADRFADFTVTLPPDESLGQAGGVEVELAARAGAVTDQTVLNLYRHQVGEAIILPTLAQSPETYFGKDDNWISLGAVRHGTTDIDAKWQSCWQPGQMTFVVTVTDNVHCQKFPPAQFWMGDSLQLALKALPSTTKATTQFCIALDQEGKGAVYVDRQLPDVTASAPARVEVRRDGTVTTYIVTIRPTTLGLTTFAVGDQLGLAVLVNDNDGDGRKGGLAWGDGIARYNGNPTAYYHLTLKNSND